MANEKPPLNVLIVGGGLAGLAVALVLQQDGHSVTVLEAQPPVLDPAMQGAGIHLPPNATRLLRRWGVDLDDVPKSVCARPRAWLVQERGRALRAALEAGDEAGVGGGSVLWADEEQRAWLFGHDADASV
ncbi:hypothetical protein GGTG_07182 [Gaeumannomyces tritici R3-111a-1]|uniref:FAD dependent oxidoreductase domain-containing protein n=1 Tax=Gaeumannomyces tritici (strain R3-111a-1) TaxID=644352 RepID=J3P0Y6_GAET3|nr:hypothetical protein GGTG_07182 [Gaeumannomyces tritici R3-111a-1]EJT77270.1 hypothetical protein GGTG_07182 [Gaeumannomyces tritici R3-111a-1]